MAFEEFEAGQEDSDGSIIVEDDGSTTTVTYVADEEEGEEGGSDDDEPVNPFQVTLTALDAEGGEDTGIHLDIGAAMKFDVLQEALPVTITGLPAGATLSHGVEIQPGVWQVPADELGMLTITPPANDAHDFSLTVSTAGSGWGNHTISAWRTFEVEVKAVADAPSMTVIEITEAVSASSAAQILSGTAGDDVINAGGGNDTIDGGAGADEIHGDATTEVTAVADLDVTAALTDLDGSESLHITVFGVPVGGSLSAGTEAEPGVWQLTPDQLAGLKITVPAGSSDYVVNVVATSVDTDPDTGDKVDRYHWSRGRNSRGVRRRGQRRHRRRRGR